ncbi:hypothetical protein TNCT_504451 [Trichonephila clavata]|uniref:Uncharacterized protein n=2 Tax=Trichonephila clavata TaxID=2740835 RepID=A0A8X6K2U9_TRICU|nr:hypothetical protein TNCT_504451 [Trichonephila clavata]
MMEVSTTTQTTTESSTIEITTETTIESTTEETTTTEPTTLETTKETTTESTTFETTESTTMETTQATTIETTLETTASETVMKPTSKSLLKTNSPKVPEQAENVNTTKSWQKYLSKSTPKPIHSSQSHVKDPKPSSTKSLLSKLNPKPSLTDVKKSVNKDPIQTVDKYSTPRTTGEKSTPSNIVFQNKSQKDDATEVNIHAPSTNQETTATTPSNNNSSVNISIDVDIDVNLRSHYTSVSPNTSADYISYDPDGTESPKDREKRYENKRIVAGVILVVLVSLSAGCAFLLVVMPSNYDVVSRKYRTRPDQVALIPPRNRCRPRFYDSSFYMGH